LLYGYFKVLGSQIVSFIEFLFSKFTNHFIVSGQRVAEDLLQAKVISKSDFTCVTPGLPIRGFPSRKSSRAEFDLKDSDFVIGWLGRLTDVKDPEMLLRIATGLPQFTFLMGGEGELYDSLIRSAPENVRLLGWVNQDRFWSSCDVAILTSKNEAQPYSLIEAIHAGKPIVARNVGSVQDVLSHGKYGLLFENVEEAISCLKEMRGDSRLLAEMSEAAISAALNDFSLDKFVEAHIAVYERAKSSEGPGNVSKK
jgi:glycosyltransferase involved in cell wall biosynthesis